MPITEPTGMAKKAKTVLTGSKFTTIAESFVLEKLDEIDLQSKYQDG